MFTCVDIEGQMNQGDDPDAVKISAFSRLKSCYHRPWDPGKNAPTTSKPEQDLIGPIQAELFNIEDTSLLDDIEAVRIASAKILDELKVVSETELEEITDKEEENDEPNEDLKYSEKVEKKKSQKRRKSEIEKLKIEGWKEPKTTKITKSSQLLYNKTDDQLQAAVKPMLNLIDIGFVSKVQNSQQGDAQGLVDQGPAGLQGGCGYDLCGEVESSAGSLFGVEVATVWMRINQFICCELSDKNSDFHLCYCIYEVRVSNLP